MACLVSISPTNIGLTVWHIYAYLPLTGGLLHTIQRGAQARPHKCSIRGQCIGIGCHTAVLEFFCQLWRCDKTHKNNYSDKQTVHTWLPFSMAARESVAWSSLKDVIKSAGSSSGRWAVTRLRGNSCINTSCSHSLAAGNTPALLVLAVTNLLI